MNIRELTRPADVDDLLNGDQPAWLFKHSRICPNSSAALGQVQLHLVEHPDQPAGMVVVQTHRPVSNYIADVTTIAHQSPQLLLVRQGTVLWHASHNAITTAAMAEAYKQHA